MVAEKSRQGTENVMTAQMSPADLEELKAAIALSPIRLRCLQARLADWATTRNSSDVDDVILAWLASQGSAAPRRLDA